jgi:hypothetical protein
VLLRAGFALLLVLTGCRGRAGAEDPAGNPRAGGEEAGRALAPEEGERSSSAPAPASPSPASEPEPPAEPAPPDFDARTIAAGLSAAVRIDEEPPAHEDGWPTRTLVVSIDGATQGDRLLSLPTGFEHCERSEAVVDPVAGQPSPLVLAQAFCESGEDEFSREIRSAVVHVGDAATAPRVLWQGKGRFSSSFGVCQRVDVPAAEVPRPGTLVIEQLTEVVFDRDRDLPEIRCRAKKARTRKLAEITF